ncbi:HDOD domain-containing protein, partial [Candidatus Hydrogenedentota bacterium]
MSKEKLESILEETVNLPSLPSVVTRVIDMASDPGASLSEVAKVIMGDPSLSLKVVKLVNSAFYGMRHKISSVDHAAPLLGMKVLKNLALTASVFSMFKEE